MKIIIGLGNPGFKYRKTRHNAGFLALDYLAGKTKWEKSKSARAEYAWIEINGEEVGLVKPQTYMNNSGQAVQAILKKHQNLSSADFIVIHDEVDLPFGEIKISQGSGSAGHKGVESIINSLGTKDFQRVRIGVGKSEDLPTDVYVLKKFSRAEQGKLKDIFSEVEKTIINII